jgi:hypothetical protein
MSDIILGLAGAGAGVNCATAIPCTGLGGVCSSWETLVDFCPATNVFTENPPDVIDLDVNPCLTTTPYGPCDDGGGLHDCFGHNDGIWKRKTFGPYGAAKTITFDGTWTIWANNECAGVGGCCCEAAGGFTINTIIFGYYQVNGGAFTSFFVDIVEHTGAGSTSKSGSKNQVFNVAAGDTLALSVEFDIDFGVSLSSFANWTVVVA